MTTIATDGRYMAADTLGSGGSHIERHRPVKIERLPGGSIAGCAGTTPRCLHLFQYLRGEINDIPRGVGDENAFALVLRPDGTVWKYDADYPTAPHEVGAPAAIGSGKDFAMGAMLAGASPDRAVEIAIELDPYTGGTVTLLAVSTPQMEFQEEFLSLLSRQDLP
jgi:ATP-dependent protease HslVU (ClpYQ) peptidase subunit